LFRVLHILNVDETYELNFSEAIWIDVLQNIILFLLCTIYRPEGSTVPFWDNFYNSIEKALSYNPQVIIHGGINVDLLSVSNHKLNEIMLLFNLRNVITEPTRVTNSSSTLTDPVLVSDTSVIPVSNHSAILVVFQLHNNVPKNIKREIWIYKDANYFYSY